MSKYYVTMTDRFLSKWGCAKERINKLVFECDSYDEAEIVAENASDRSEMKYIDIKSKKPLYLPSTYLVDWKTKEGAARWYEKGAFK